MTGEREDGVGARLEADRRDLLDLSLRNPLLNYRPRARGVEVVGESPAQVLRTLVHEGKRMTFLPAPEPEPEPQTEPEPQAEETTPDVEAAPVERDDLPERAPIAADQSDLKLQTALPPEALHGRLLATYYAARTSLEEQGVGTLFLALGMLAWSEAHNGATRSLRAPLLLVPVELERSGARERFRIRFSGEDLGVNLSLAEKLRTGFGIALPEPPEADELDADRYFDAVAGAVAGQEGWAVDRGAVALGFFSFGKFLMYRDLDGSGWPEGARPEDHPIIRALLGDGFVEGRDEEENAAGAVRTVLDADGTQGLALRDAAAGRHLVIQGPPGTGKSQTITNLIADAVGRGRTVLFVAEKMAALEVVKRRLDAVGLGDACLELHSHKTRKKAVLDALRRALSARRPTPAPSEADREALAELRDDLDAYAKAVASPIGESGVAPHDAIGELLRLEGDAGAELPHLENPGMATWSAGEFRRLLARVERLQARLDALGSGGLEHHPFRGSRRSSFRPGDEDRLRDLAQAARQATSALRDAAASLARFLRQTPPADRAGCETLARSAQWAEEAARWPGAQVRGGEWLSRREDVRELLDAGAALADLHHRHDASLLPESWGEDVTETRGLLNAHGRSWWRFLRADYRRARARLAGLCRGEPPPGLDERLALLDAVAEVRRLRDALGAHEPLAARLFGRLWRGERSDWPRLAELADRMLALHGDVREGRLPRGLLDFLADAPTLAGLDTLARALHAALGAHHHAGNALLDFLDVDPSGRDLDAGDFREQEARFEAWARDPKALADLAAVNEQAARCRAEGLEAVATLAETWPGAARRLADAFRRGRCAALLRRAFDERPALADAYGPDREAAVAQFQDLDRKSLGHDRAEIARASWGRLPRHEAGGQLAVLRREFAKKARHLPVRQLMARAGRAVQATAPVFLMSPLSVAAYLPPGALEFDLVVFDEASQVRPIDALGALARGRQAVVVGDSRQLPPTSFFDRLTGGGDEADDDEATADVESILGLFVAQGAPQRLLRWHYRSRHESLIAVSNREFYDDRLIVFPGPDASRDHAGLVLRHLPETAYDRGGTRTNAGEAEAVAEAVMAHARAQLDRPAGERQTLGVAAFGASQVQAIRDHLERLRRREPACEAFFDPEAADPFFIKNLENVQGDERDVIFISVGYGRTAEGALTMNFGPLNAEGGERRLNVLITRARVRCEVFTNLTAADLDAGRSRSRGVAALRTFLAFAETGRFDDAPAPAAGGAGSPFAAAVREALAASGCRLVGPVGSPGAAIDLAVLDPGRPGRYRLGLSCDGPAAGDLRSARDRERLRPQVLEGLGWRLARAWAPDWYRDPDRARERLLAIIQDSPMPDGQCPTREGRDTTTIGHRPSALGPGEVDRDGPPAAEPEPRPADVPDYRVATLPKAIEGADLAGVPVAELAAWVVAVVTQEGPVHRDEVARRLAEAAKARRMGPRMQEAIEAAGAGAVERGEIARRGEFFWPAGRDRPVVRDRGALPAASRRLELVAPEEIAEAAAQVVAEGFGLEPAAVAPAACRRLGFPRLTEEMRARVEAVIGTMIDGGRLARRGDHLVVPAAESPASPPVPAAEEVPR